MKYIIVGLGNFGSVLAERFTQMGYEVIGVDRNIERVEDIKSKISVAVCLSVLPLESADGVIIALGKEFGESLMAYAIFKEYGVNRLIVRAVSEIHATVLSFLGVEHIIFPEKDAAQKYALSLDMQNYLSSYKLDDDTFIVQMYLPKRFVGLKLSMINFKSDHKVKFISLKRKVEIINMFGAKHKEVRVVDVEKGDIKLNEEDIIILLGSFANLSRFGR